MERKGRKEIGRRIGIFRRESSMKIGRMGVVVGGGRARVGKNRNKSRKLKLHGRAEWSGVVAAEMARRVIDVPNRAKCFSTRHLATPVLVSSNWPGFHRISYWKTRVHAFRQLSKPTLRPDSRRASYEGLTRIRLVAPIRNVATTK